jgi:hypothetical protein
MKQFFLRNSAPILTFLLTCLLMTGAGTAFAQRNERIHAIKVGYLTDRLKLSAEQAATFWPVYDAYEAEARATRRQFRQSQQQQGQPANDEQATRQIDDNLDYQEAILAINKRYRDRFLKVISPTQLATLYDAERDFRKLLLQQLKDRRGK